MFSNGLLPTTLAPEIMGERVTTASSGQLRCPKCKSLRYGRHGNGRMCLDCGHKITYTSTNTAPRRIGQVHGNVWGEIPERKTRTRIRKVKRRQPKQQAQAEDPQARRVRLNDIYEDAQRLLAQGKPYDAFKQLLHLKKNIGGARKPAMIESLWQEIRAKLAPTLRLRAAHDWDNAGAPSE